MENAFNFLHHFTTRHITKSIQSIVKSQGGRLLLVNVPKLSNVALTEPINHVLIGLETKVVTICKASGNGNNKSANVPHVFALYLRQSILAEIREKLLERFNCQATHFKYSIYQNLKIGDTSPLVDIEKVKLVIHQLLELGIKAALK
ncbi:MAG: hypothetical protein EBV06_16940 [Planctomycetia bacterium]|nr:hypothetical protein [Planctomycetia bacterium]